MQESNELKQAWEYINVTLEMFGLPWGKESLRSTSKNPIMLTETSPGKIYVVINVERLGNSSFERGKILIALVNAFEKKYEISKINSWQGFKGFFIKAQANNSSKHQT